MISQAGHADPWRDARLDMVARQLAGRGIQDRRVLDVLSQVPRERFVPQALVSSAYADGPLAIGHGQTISQPYMVAVMTEMLELKGQESVLEIGTGSGYQTMVLARLARHVTSVELIAPLSQSAGERLADLEVGNVTLVVGDGSEGHEACAPYDRILVTAGAPCTPEPLKAQLAMGGILVIPVGGRHEQELLRIVRTEKGDLETRLLGCIFVPLVGRYGWESQDSGGATGSR